MWVTGPTYVEALPPLVVLQVLVLGPIAVLCVYGIASHIGGRLLGYWASFLWVIAPFAAIPLFVDRYQERWTEHFVPQALGLTAMADFPSTVLVLASALFVVRSLDADHDRRPPRRAPARRGRRNEAPNLLMGFGAVLDYLVARRWRGGHRVLRGRRAVAARDPPLEGAGPRPASALAGGVRLAAGATGVVALDIDRYIERSTSTIGASR